MRNSATSVLLSRALSVAVAVGSLPLIARGLGPHGRGETASALAYIQLLPIVLSLGLPSQVRRDYAAVDDSSRDMSLRVARMWACIAGSVSIVLTWAATRTVFESLGSSATTSILVTAPLCTATGIAWLCDANALVGAGRTFQYAVVLAVPSVAQGALIASLSIFGALTVPNIIWTQLVSYFLTAMASHALVGPLRSRFHVTPARKVLASSSQYAGSRLAEALSYRLDQTLVLPILGASSAGIYSVAATVALLPLAVGQSVASATFSQIVGVPRDRQSFDRDVSTLLAATRISGALACLGTAALSPLIVPLALGDAFRAAVFPIWIGVLGSYFLVMGQAVMSLLIRSARGWRMTGAQIAGLSVGTCLLFVLGPLLGAAGASFASATGYFLTLVLMMRPAGVRLLDLIVRPADFTAMVGVFTHGRL